MRKPILAGNWKMHKTSAETSTFFKELNTRQRSAWGSAQIIFAVPYTLLSAAKAAAGDSVSIIAQNVHFEDSGAFTGEIAADQLLDIGIQGSLVGHSERRQFFGETDEGVSKKVAKLLSKNMVAVACVGETQAEREQDQTESVLARQVEAIFKAAETVQNLVIAYEPVWAIGTGLTASDEQAQAAHRFIRQLAEKHYGTAAAEQLQILYGGSAKPGNIGGLISQPDIDGGLIGGASLKAEDFAAMVDIVTN